MFWQDRKEAGRALAEALGRYAGQDVVVVGLPRGGVVVAAEVAAALRAPLDVRVAKKIPAPGQPELAIGAVTAQGARVLYGELLAELLLPPGWLDAATAEARAAARAREQDLRGLRPAEPLAGRTAILVDDGIATGMTVMAAIADVADEGPRELVVAAPVIAPETARRLAKQVDRVVSLREPPGFRSVGEYFHDFRQTGDAEVRSLLTGALRRA